MEARVGLHHAAVVSAHMLLETLHDARRGEELFETGIDQQIGDLF
jgi:hypothetical protein